MRTPLKQTSTRRHGSAYKGSSLAMLGQDASLPSSGSYAAHSWQMVACERLTMPLLNKTNAPLALHKSELSSECTLGRKSGCNLISKWAGHLLSPDVQDHADDMHLLVTAGRAEGTWSLCSICSAAASSAALELSPSLELSRPLLDACASQGSERRLDIVCSHAGLHQPAYHLSREEFVLMLPSSPWRVVHADCSVRLDKLGTRR